MNICQWCRKIKDLISHCKCDSAKEYKKQLMENKDCQCEDKDLNDIKKELSSKFKCNCWIGFYSVAVILIAGLLCCAIFCLLSEFKKSSHNIICPVSSVNSKADSNSTNGLSSKIDSTICLKECCKKLQHNQDYLFNKNAICIGGNINMNANSRLYIESSNPQAKNILWFIGFLVFAVLALVFSIPVIIAARTKNYMKFYKDTKELYYNHNETLAEYNYKETLEKIKQENEKNKTVKNNK